MLLACAACLTTAACVGEDSVLFVTTTNIGIDADTTPPNIAVAYDRYEGYFGPTYANGALPPVYARLQSNSSVFNPKIKQTYATGEAARLISKGEQSGETAPPKLTGDKRIAFAGTTATVGLKVTFSPEGPPESVTLGYKRKEYSLIPVMTQGEGDAKEDTYASVVASFGINTETTKIGESGLGVSQFFATGIAAKNLASDPVIQELFKQQAKASLTAFAWGVDNNSDILKNRVEDDTYRKRLNKWLTTQNNNNCAKSTELISNAICADLRAKAVKEVL